MSFKDKLMHRVTKVLMDKFDDSIVQHTPFGMVARIPTEHAEEAKQLIEETALDFVNNPPDDLTSEERMELKMHMFACHYGHEGGLM